MERVEVAEVRRGLHLLRDVPALQPVDLVQRDHDRDAERVDALRDEAVAGADPLARREHEEHGLDVLERGVDRVLHPLGQRVERALEARAGRRGRAGSRRRSRSRRCGAASSAACRRRSRPCRRRARSRASTCRRSAGPRPRRSPTSRQVPGVGQELSRPARSRRSSRPRGGSRRARSSTRAATGGSRRTATR